MTDERAYTISKFVELALNFTERKREASYEYLILCLCSQITEVLAEREEAETLLNVREH